MFQNHLVLIIAGHLFYCDTSMRKLFVKVSEHAGISKYHDQNIGPSFIYFLHIITVPLYSA